MSIGSFLKWQKGVSLPATVVEIQFEHCIGISHNIIYRQKLEIVVLKNDENRDMPLCFVGYEMKRIYPLFYFFIHDVTKETISLLTKSRTDGYVPYWDGKCLHNSNITQILAKRFKETSIIFREIFFIWNRRSTAVMALYYNLVRWLKFGDNNRLLWFESNRQSVHLCCSACKF